jgi:hypothetical protein
LNVEQRSTTSLNAGYGSTTSYDIEGRSSSSPTDVHAHGGISKIHHKDVPTLVEPLALSRVIHFIFKHKNKLIIFFSRPELHATSFALIFPLT